MNIIRHLLLALLFAFSFVFYSCTDKDYYDQSNSTATEAGLFSDSISISSSFDWSTTKTVNLTVTVDDQYDGQYTYRIDVYDANPLFDESASLLGAGVAKSGLNFEQDIVVPTAADIVYVEQTDPTGKRQITAVSVSTSAVTLDLSSKSTSSISSSLKLSSLSTKVNALSSSVTTEPSVPDDAIEINNSVTSFSISADNSTHKNYVIKEGVNYTGTISFNGGWGKGISLYIQGSWTNSGASASLGNADYLYVLSGATASINSFSASNTANFYNYGTFTVGGINFTNSTVFENDGTFTSTGTSTFSSSVSLSNSGTATFSTLNITNSFTFSNSGTVSASNATFSNGSFVNTGTATFSSLTSTTSSTTIENDGTLTATEASLTNATLDANCHTTIGTLTTSGAIVNIASGALLDVTTLTSGGTYYYLAASSILDVSATAYFTSQQNYMVGSGTSTALAKMTKVTSEWKGITYQGYLQIECSDHTANTLYNTYYVLESPAAFVPSGESSIEIASTDCNDGGNNVTSTAVEDQTVTEVTLATYSYAFEDNWPSYGDYDMNDFVSDITLTQTQNTDGQLTKLVITAKLRAVGASRRIGAAIQLDGVEASAVKSVTYSNSEIVGTNFPLASNGVESGQTYAVVPIADDVHAAFGYSTPTILNTSTVTADPVTVTITIEFASAIDLLDNDDLNVFIVTAGYVTSKRTEIHLLDKESTDKENTALFSSANLFSSAEPYRSHEGLVWGLCIPGSFDYPAEAEKITTKYIYFEPWAASGGTAYTTWYKGN
ncbi:MAG: hypothetical protein H6Q14_2363 [Bacteroidetes bacterium]|nr:hypothetical protein [Bacteroidota bacterium]